MSMDPDVYRASSFLIDDAVPGNSGRYVDQRMNIDAIITATVHRMIDADTGLGNDTKINPLLVRQELAFQQGMQIADLAPLHGYIKGVISDAVASHADHVRLRDTVTVLRCRR
eukprot:5846635-Prymnesium_polylepis.1